MPENTLEHLLPVQNEIGETPIWVSKEQALYWMIMSSPKSIDLMRIRVDINWSM